MINVNFTIEIDEFDLIHFEKILGDHYKIIDLRILPDTKELYDKDERFRELVSNYRTARRVKDDYVNRKL